jgi:membrane protein DedA with SNARE-associated domain
MAALAVTDWAQRLMDDHGYLALGSLVLVENLFPPIPSEVVLPLAGFYVGQGAMTFALALLAATAGSVLGALLLYALGRWGGRPLLLRWGRVLRLDRRRLDRADDWFDRHGWKLVLFGRVVPGMRSIVSIPAGSSEMPVGRFLALTAAGSLVWNAALIGAGWSLGSNWHAVEQVVAPVGTAVLVLLVVGAVAGVVVLRRRQSA